MNKLVICNKAGLGMSCIHCVHSEPHKPMLIDPQWDLSTDCRKTDDCSLIVNGGYVENIRVKCKSIKEKSSVFYVVKK